jgi:hypothetical protein
MDKYTKAIELFNTCTLSAPDNVNECVDNFLLHIHTTFEAPRSSPENIVECKNILLRKISKEDILRIPTVVSDDMYPVALMKLLLTEYQLPIIASKIMHFNAFHSRYGSIIIQSMM